MVRNMWISLLGSASSPGGTADTAWKMFCRAPSRSHQGYRVERGRECPGTGRLLRSFTQFVRERAQQIAAVYIMALQTVFNGPNGAEHANLLGTGLDVDIFTHLQGGERFLFKVIQRPGRGVAQLAHARQMLGQVDGRLLMLEQADQF